MEALGRPADFDPKRDSIVRVEAHRLRKRLRQYYAAQGADRAVQIDLPPGQYRPAFIQTAPPPVAAMPETVPEAAERVPDVFPIDPVPADLPVAAQARVRPAWALWLAVVAGLSLLSLSLVRW